MANSRDHILSRIRQNKPDASPLPDIPAFEGPAAPLEELFAENVVKVGGSVIQDIPLSGIQEQLSRLFPDASHRWSGMAEAVDSTVTIDPEPHSLALLDLAVVQGTFGVAENGAIWVEESALPHRVLAFITQHLVLLLDKTQLVWNMHQAYARLGTELPGFGLFISGPSKTADIEQSLVIGAHGPKSLTVFLL